MIRRYYNITENEYRTPLNKNGNYMIRKIVLLWVILICYNTTFAQHMVFEGISFESSLEAFNQELINRGFLLVEDAHVDNDDGSLFYKGSYKGVDISVFISYTPHSKKVYNISLLYDEMYHDKFKEYIENKYNVEPVDNDTKHRIAPYSRYLDYVYNISNIGMIILSNHYNGNVKIIDNEYNLLWKAESWYPNIIKKRDLKRWQRKYKNPLFYDENPSVNKQKKKRIIE